MAFARATGTFMAGQPLAAPVGPNGNPPPSEAPPPLPPPPFVALPTAEEIRAIVARHAPVYDLRSTGDTVAMYLTLDAARADEVFDAVRRDLLVVGYVPILKYEGGEHVLVAVPKPPLRQRSPWVHLALYLATWATTILAGTEVYFHYHYWDLLQPLQANDPGAVLSLVYAPENILGGFLLFALPLMLTLTIHELGHYVMAKRHGVAASLPFFLPLPPLFSLNIGTMGAFISMREPIPHRRALLDIGVSGPLCGLAIALPVTLLGLFLMQREPVVLPPVEGLAYLGAPLLYDALSAPFHLNPSQLIHPTAFAGWVGLLVTGINLLPAGQLDGGHVAHALLGDRSKYLSFAAVGALLIMGIGLPAMGAFPGFRGYGGWLIFALLVAFLGVHHPEPLNAVGKLDARRAAVGWIAMLVLVVCFTPLPVS